MKAILAMATAALVLALGMAACGGSGIPDGVEWEVIGGMVEGREPDNIGGGNYRVRLNKSVSEEVLRVIGNDVRSRHINICRYRVSDCQWYADLSTVGVWFYLPGMDITDVAWASAFFLPDEEQIQIIGDLQSR